MDDQHIGEAEQIMATPGVRVVVLDHLDEPALVAELL
jgi:hypothetical protein